MRIREVDLLSSGGDQTSHGLPPIVRRWTPYHDTKSAISPLTTAEVRQTRRNCEPVSLCVTVTQVGSWRLIRYRLPPSTWRLASNP